MRRDLVRIVCAGLFAVCAVLPPAALAGKAPSVRCADERASTVRKSASAVGKCAARFGQRGDAAERVECEAEALSDALELLARTDAKVGDEGYDCPGDVERLELAGEHAWLSAAIDANVFVGSPPPDACAGKRAKAVTKLAGLQTKCRVKTASKPERLPGCLARAETKVTKKWDSDDCPSASFTPVVDTVTAAVERQFAAFDVRCGDAEVAGFEQCDDGNDVTGDGCEPNCGVSLICGNGFLQGENAEQCDDGNTAVGDGCDADCLVEVCGNGVVQVGEECDDADESALCDHDCTAALCGDEQVNAAAGEVCDRGGDDASCDGDCTPVACGDGYANPAAGEQCDDANDRDGDGCTAECRAEDCAVVGGEVACFYCPPGSSPTPAYDACACDAGFVDGPDGCTDIDECAAGTDGCAQGRPCVNLPGSFSCSIPCTEAAFHQAIADCGAPGGAITFDCTDTTIELANFGGHAARAVHCDDLLIDGLDRNVAFANVPACFDVAVDEADCPDGLRPDGGCDCPDVDGGTHFLGLMGDRITVRNLTVRHFFDGIRTHGEDATVEDVAFERLCDDAFGNETSGVGNVFRYLSVERGCDKCSQSRGDKSATAAEPELRDYYNAVYSHIDFDGCAQPIRLADGGRYLVEQSTMSGGADPDFPCQGPRFTSTPSDDLVVHFFDNVLDGCDRGLRLGLDTEALVAGNTITGGRFRGFLAKADARAALWENTVTGNGGVFSSEPGFGGVALDDDAVLSLGGGSVFVDGDVVSSPGGNTICDNVAADGSPRNVDNLTGATVKAEHNAWCTEDPQSTFAGPVDATPVLQ